jgi:hypothetical protein
MPMTGKAAYIEHAVYDLKTVNQNKKAGVDTRRLLKSDKAFPGPAYRCFTFI